MASINLSPPVSFQASNYITETIAFTKLQLTPVLDYVSLSNYTPVIFSQVPLERDLTLLSLDAPMGLH